MRIVIIMKSAANTYGGFARDQALCSGAIITCILQMKKNQGLETLNNLPTAIRSVMELESKVREPDFKTDQQRADLFSCSL